MYSFWQYQRNRKLDLYSQRFYWQNGTEFVNQLILYGYWNDSELLDQCYSDFNLSLLMIRKMKFKFEKMIFTFDICKLCKNKKIWYDRKWNNSPQKLNKMTQKSSTIDQCTASNNKQNKYLIVSYKRSKNDKCNTKKKMTALIIY